MAGEMSKSEVTREAYPLHFALADKLGCEVEPFDQYQGPYVASDQGRLFLSSDDGAFCVWYNERSEKSSQEFLANESTTSGFTEAILFSNAAAEEVVTFPPTTTYYAYFSKRLTVQGTMEIEAPNAATAQRIATELMANEETPLQTTDSRISWDEPEYVDESFVLDEILD